MITPRTTPVVRDVTFRHTHNGYSLIDVTLTNEERIEGIIRYLRSDVTLWAADLTGLTPDGVRDHHVRKELEQMKF